MIEKLKFSFVYIFVYIYCENSKCYHNSPWLNSYKYKQNESKEMKYEIYIYICINSEIFL